MNLSVPITSLVWPISPYPKSFTLQSFLCLHDIVWGEGGGGGMQSMFGERGRGCSQCLGGGGGGDAVNVGFLTLPFLCLLREICRKSLKLALCGTGIFLL